MKRDMDLVREILFGVESHPNEYLDSNSEIRAQFPLSQWPVGVFPAYIRMLQEAGLVDATINSAGQGSHEDHVFFLRLTWEGHEFIADARDPGVWEKVKSKAGDASFTVVKQILAEVVRGALR